MNIDPLRHTFAKNYLKVSNKKASSQQGAQKSTPPHDSIDISPAALFRQKVAEAQDLTRQEKLKSIAQEVQNGTYVNDEKLSVAVDSAIESALEGL